MSPFDDVKSFRRRELGVDMICHVKRGGWIEIVATSTPRGRLTDAPSVYDSGGGLYMRDFRNALRRHARWILRGAPLS